MYVAATAPRHDGPHDWRIWFAALFGFAFTVAVFHPGYMSADSIDQLTAARTGVYGDWHPPLMAWVWGWLDRVAPGPIGMLVLHNGLFWSGLALVVQSCPRLGKWAPAVLLLIGLWPANFALLGTIWKDVGMAAALLAAFGLVRLAAERGRRWPLGLALVATFYAVGVRHNGLVAALPILVYAAGVAHRVGWPDAWAAATRRRRSVVAVGSAIAGLGLVLAANTWISRSLVPRSLHPVQQILVHDLVALSLARNEFLLPPELTASPDPWTVDELRPLYWPSIAPLYWGPGTRRLPISSESSWLAELRALWLEHVPANLGAYLRHRWSVFRDLIGRQDEPFHPGIDRNDLGVELQPSRLNRGVTKVLRSLRHSVVFRVDVYALVLLLLLTYSRWRPRTGAGAVGVLATSGLLYLAVAFFVSPVPDYRFGHWTVLCTLLAATVAVGSRRSC